MFGSAQTCHFQPRIQVRKNDRPRPRTFGRFRLYQEALEEASAAMLESTPFSLCSSMFWNTCGFVPLTLALVPDKQ